MGGWVGGGGSVRTHKQSVFVVVAERHRYWRPASHVCDTRFASRFSCVCVVYWFANDCFSLFTLFRYEFMLKEAHVQAWMVVHALINGYGRTQPGCRDDLLAFLFQLSYCKVRAAFNPLVCRRACGVMPNFATANNPP